jgi:protein-tyrosine phosphatase
MALMANTRINTADLRIFTDYHSHVLPGMDDGAQDLATSTTMMTMYRNQHVKRLVATPHYYAHKETVHKFLKRREEAFNRFGELRDYLTVLPGAEVRVEHGLCETPQVDRLTMGESKCILFELPFSPLKEWMLSEVLNIAYSYKITPIFAHIERYTELFTTEDMERLLSIQDAVYQISNRTLFKRDTRAFVLDLANAGYKIVFGSDAHNSHERFPNNIEAFKTLRFKLSKEVLTRLLEFSENLL